MSRARSSVTGRYEKLARARANPRETVVERSRPLRKADWAKLAAIVQADIENDTGFEAIARNVVAAAGRLRRRK